MLKRFLLALFAVTAPAFAQTGIPTLIAHVEAAGGTSSPIDSTGANFAAVCTRQGVKVTDSANNTWTTALLEQGAFDGDGCSWYVAFALHTSKSHTFTVSDGNPFQVVLFNHIASGPDQTAVNLSGSYDGGTRLTTAVLGPITPSKPNELILSGVEAVFPSTTPPAVKMDHATVIGTAAGTGSGYLPSYSVGYTIAGSGTPTAYSNTVVTNQQNGGAPSLITLYSDLSPSPLSVANSSLPDQMRTVAYPTTCATVKGGTAPYALTVSGTLPAGLTVSNGCIAGTPKTAGAFSGIQFHVVDHAGATAASAPLSIGIKPYGSILTLPTPAYGNIVMKGAKRHPGVTVEHPGKTGLMNYSIQEGSGYATLSCTSNCPGTVEVDVTATPGACSVTGTVGSYAIKGATAFHLVATAVDTNEDGGHSSVSSLYQVCKGDHLVETQPTYEQAFIGQDKVFYSYTLGQVEENATWSCTRTEDKSDCSSMLSGADHRDVRFTGTAVGHYRLTATSVSTVDGTKASNYSTVYVGGKEPSACGPTTPSKTEVVACFADPATFGSNQYTVCPGGSCNFTHIFDLPFGAGMNKGFLGRIMNADTTGHNPTQYAEYMNQAASGTRDKPVHICGVVDNNACHNPVIQQQGAIGKPGSPPFDTYVFHIVPSASQSGPAGYDTSNGPDYIDLTGIDFRADGNAANVGIAIGSRSGRHLNLEGISVNDYAEGTLLQDNSIYTGRTGSDYQSVIGSYFNNCGNVPGYGNHCVYLQGLHPLLVGNYFGSMVPDSAGSWVKERGGGSIFAYNTFVGATAGPAFWWGDEADEAPYTNVEMTLGPPGDKSVDHSPYSQSHDINILHIIENEETFAHDYFYGNVTSNWNATVPLFSYSAMNVEGCAADYALPCTNGDDHTGGFMVWNNTFDRPDPALGMSADVFYNNGYSRPGVYSWPFVTYQNNSIWTDTADGRKFFIDLAPVFQGKFTTNLFAPSAMKITPPIVPVDGPGGWGNQIGGGGTNGPITFWSAYSPKESYLRGISPANFLTSATMPYNARTFVPTTGSRLVGAGTALTDPLMAAFNLFFEPDPQNGYMIRRNADATTIGARTYVSGPQPTVVSQKIAEPKRRATPISINLPAGGGCAEAWDCLTVFSTWSDGFVENDGYRAANWKSSNPRVLTFDRGTDSTYQVHASQGSGTASASYDPQTGRYVGLPPATGEFVVGNGANHGSR